MQIQERIPQQSIQTLIRDKTKFRKIMLILQQTLYDLGYHQSANMLQKQSGIPYLTNQLLSFKQCLVNNDFQSAIKVVDSFDQELNKNKKTQISQQLSSSINHNNQNEKMIEDDNQFPSLLNYCPNQNNINHKNQQINGKTTNTILSHSSVIQTKNMIYQTFCMHKILNQEFQQAMKIISQHIENQNKKETLCEALVLGNHHLTKFDIQKKKQEIFKYCLSEYQQIGQKQIQKVISSYTEHQGILKYQRQVKISQIKGQDNKQLKKLLSLSKRQPPIKLLTSQFEQSIKNTITHMKLNKITNQLILIDQGKNINKSQGRDSQQMSILQFNSKNYQYHKQMGGSGIFLIIKSGKINEYPGNLSLKVKYPIFSPLFNRAIDVIYKNKRQSLESIAFNNNKDNPLVALASYSIIQIYNSKLDIICSIESRNKIQKNIYIDFHPISDLLYNCGYFESMQIFDSAGQQLMSIYPYPKTRKFIFYKSQIIGISLVTNKFYKHSVQEQVLIKEMELDQGAIPMDLCTNDKQDKLVISSMQFLYFINVESLQIIGKTTSPFNPNKVIIQIKFYGDYLISLSKNFTAFTFGQDKMSQKENSLIIKKYKQWLGEGTYQINEQIMISGNKQIKIWQQADEEYLMDEESLEQQMENSNVINIQLQEEGNLSESQLNSNEIEDEDSEEDDSMDEEDEDISV